MLLPSSASVVSPLPAPRCVSQELTPQTPCPAALARRWRGGGGGGPAWTPCLPRGSASVSSPGQPSGKNFVLRSDLPLPLPSLPPCSPSLGMQAPPWSSSHPRPIHLSAPRGWQGGAGRKEPACSSRHPFCWRLLPCGALVDLCVAVGEVIA